MRFLVLWVANRLLGAVRNNPQLIEKLAESTPIRRAAQLTSYVIVRLRIQLEDNGLKNFQFKRFAETFRKELEQAKKRKQ